MNDTVYHATAISSLVPPFHGPTGGKARTEKWAETSQPMCSPSAEAAAGLWELGTGKGVGALRAVCQARVCGLLCSLHPWGMGVPSSHAVTS